MNGVIVALNPQMVTSSSKRYECRLYYTYLYKKKDLTYL